jgi:hypothetical protein
VLGPYREGQGGALNRVQKRAAKFANNLNEWGSEALIQRRLIARICALFSIHTPEDGLENRLLKPKIIIRKLGIENKDQMLVNIPSQLGQLKARNNYLHVY